MKIEQMYKITHGDLNLLLTHEEALELLEQLKMLEQLTGVKGLKIEETKPLKFEFKHPLENVYFDGVTTGDVVVDYKVNYSD